MRAIALALGVVLMPAAAFAQNATPVEAAPVEGVSGYRIAVIAAGTVAGVIAANWLSGGLITPPGPDSTGASTTGATTTACGYAADWLTADGSAQDPHPHAINPPSGFLTNWNNKPAPEWSAADSNFGFGSIYRVMSLTDRVRATLASGPATPVAIVNDMEDAGSVDLDGSKLVPPMLAVLGPGGKPEERSVSARGTAAARVTTTNAARAGSLVSSCSDVIARARSTSSAANRPAIQTTTSRATRLRSWTRSTPTSSMPFSTPGLATTMRQGICIQGCSP